jgi:hypothetical protein
MRAFGMVCAGSLALTLAVAAQSTSTSKPAPGPAAPAVKTFDTAQHAADALLTAAAAFDVSAIEALFGPQGRELVVTGDSVQDKSRLDEFSARAREKSSVAVDPANANRAILIVGSNDWPMPVPIVKKNGKWSFDAAAGRIEILNRRVGSNELDAIDICRGFVEAQHEYALTKHDGAEVNQYAQRIIATPGKQDGLAWKNPDGSWDGPVGEGVARAISEGYSEKTEPYHGYFFKVLKGQGPAAPLGQMDYVIKGVMIGGFALVAAPAEYGVTGVMTFMVSNDGVVYQKDFGDNSLTNFKTMERFDPDKTWTPVSGR